MKQTIKNSHLVDIKKYSFKKKIGVGGFSEVYLAIDSDNGDKVAIKRFNDSFDQKNLKFFKREIENMSKVLHPYSVKCFGYTFDPKPAIIMEYFSKGSLYRILHSKNNQIDLNLPQKFKISLCLSHTLMVIHDKKIIHRDMKSSNILLDDLLLPHICDYGVSRYIAKNTVLTHGVGPINWMAPEVMRDQDYSFPADVFSFAMVLYEIFTGNIPWDGLVFEQIFEEMVIKNMRPPLSEIIPSCICNIIKKCWNKDPLKRFTMRDVYSQLKDAEELYVGISEEEKKYLLTILESSFKKKQDNVHSLEIPKKASDNDRISSLDSRTKHVLYKRQNENIVPEMDSQFIDIEAISDPKNLFFRAELKKASVKLLKIQSRSFFNGVSKVLSTKTRIAELKSVLEALTLILQNHCHLKVFIANNIHQMIPIEEDQLFDISMDILNMVVLFQSSAVLTGFENKLKYLISKDPIKAIIIFGHCLKSNVPDSIINILLNNSPSFLDTPASPEFISIINHICLNKNSILKNNRYIIEQILKQVLVFNNDQAIIFSYDTMIELGVSYYNIDMLNICKHVNHKTIAPHALSFLLRQTDLPFDEQLILALIQSSLTHQEALFCLLPFCSLEDGAKILSNNPFWLSKECPTLFSTLQILLACLVHIPIRSKLSKTNEIKLFITNLSKMEDRRILTYISNIIRILPISPQFISQLSQLGFFKQVCSLILELDETPELISGFSIVFYCSEIAFAAEYLIISERLKQSLLSSSTVTQTAIITLVSLSKYPLCAKKYQDLKLAKFFNQLIQDPEYREAATIFLQGLKQTEFYK